MNNSAIRYPRPNETLPEFCKRLSYDDLLDWTVANSRKAEEYLVGTLELQRRIYAEEHSIPWNKIQNVMPSWIILVVLGIMIGMIGMLVSG